MKNTLVDAILSNAEKQPEKKALAFRNEILTYGEVAKKMVEAAAFLKQCGIRKGDRVVITAVSKPEYVIAFLAVQYLGAVTVPVDKNAKIENVRMIVEAVHADTILTDTQGEIEGINVVSLKKIYAQDNSHLNLEKEQVAGTDLIELLFTTGTTGKPKGAMLTVDCILANMKNTFNGIGIREDDVILLPLPLNHSFGIRVLRSTFYAGATLVLQNGFSFAKEIENNISMHNCTGLAAVSASMDVILGQMQDRARDILGKLRYIEISAGALDKRLRKKIPMLLPNVELHNTWGSTESGGALFLNLTKHPEKIDSIGKPLEGISIKVLDENNKEIVGNGPEHVGRMALKGEMQMAGYWEMPEMTEKTLVDGWLITNDLVYLDQDGYVYMLGRADDIINVCGEKVSPVEVENIVNDNDHVKECGCIGVPDPEGLSGQIVVLFVVPNDSGYSENELKQFMSNRLEQYKVPTKIIPIQALPRNNMKKLDRKALKNIWDSQGGESLMNPVMQAIMGRRSIRRFADKPIDKKYIQMIVQAGAYAPSGHNMQSWKFTAITNLEKIEQLKKLTIETADKNDVMCYGFENPKALILVSNDSRNPYGCQDASAASENIMLAAYSFGLGSVWLNPLMTLRDKEPVKTLLDEFGIPENHTVWSMIALGYPESNGVMLAKRTDTAIYIE